MTVETEKTVVIVIAVVKEETVITVVTAVLK